MKKWLSVISILVLVIVLAGCGKDKEDNKNHGSCFTCTPWRCVEES